MFKLVAVGGKIRGKEWSLNEGENRLGRSHDCDINVDLQGISKKHLSITVNGETAFLEDLGSSNGTFCNGKLIRKTTITKADKIAIPNVIFQLVWVKEKKVVVKKKVPKTQSGSVDDSFGEEPPMPKSLAGKLIHIFKYKVMPIIYGFNETNEWRVLFAILMAIFIAITIGLTISPVLTTSKKILTYELQNRATSYANQIERLNAKALSRGNIDRLETAFLSNEEGVRTFELFDIEGNIVSPVERSGRHVSDTFSVEALEGIRGLIRSKKGYDGRTFVAQLGGGELGIAKGIRAFDVNKGKEVTVGIVAIRFAPKSLNFEANESNKAYLESLITASLVAIFFFGMIYYLTMRPIEELRYQVEECLRGSRKELESRLLFSELKPLRNTINSMISRIRELSSDSNNEFEEMEDDGKYIRMLEEFLRGHPGSVVVLDSEKNIKRINHTAEDLIGLRESLAVDTSLLDSLKDQGLAATIIELCDNSANSEGLDQTEVYEISGREYDVHVTSLIGKDSFAKAFYVSFVEAD